MKHPQSPRYLELLERLDRGKVRFIVVGGVAAILEGAPITTLDLDVVYERSPENLERLLEVLESVEANTAIPRVVISSRRWRSSRLSG